LKVVCQNYEKIKTILYKIELAIVVGLWAYINHEMININTLKILTDFLVLILKVSTENKHLITHIGCLDPQTDQKQQIVSVWAGAGISANPIQRIEELINENKILRSKLITKNF
jgi:hypothetical protein